MARCVGAQLRLQQRAVRGRVDVSATDRPVSTSRSKMAVSVFPGVRLLSIGDANGDIQRHSEQQPLRLEVKTSQDAALINLSNGESTFFPQRLFGCSACLKLLMLMLMQLIGLYGALATKKLTRLQTTSPPPARHEGALKTQKYRRPMLEAG